MGKKSNGVTEYTWGARRSPKKLLLIIGGVAVVIAAAVAGILYFGAEPASLPGTTADASTEERTAERVIDGKLVPPGDANPLPVAVMIENLVSARPQSGLREANVVYEALAEGGITRFLAVYAFKEPIAAIGPVRSARSYYLDWAKEYGALYAHIGGSPQALAEILTKDIFDLNQFFNAQYFWRDEGRAPPHNLYTSSEKLAYALRDKNAPSMGSYASWEFKDDLRESERPSGEKTLEIDFSSFSYKVKYVYDRTANSYQRFQAGEPHVDSQGKQIVTKNIVVQYSKTTLADGEGRLSVKTTGEGDAVIFRDGEAIVGTWKKDTPESRATFSDSSGQIIELNRGNTWIEIVPADRQITYT